ncbi:MAG: hypothetical protein EBY26_02305 [Microbacteriaceae bacterium]|nr:hypothetical protein [Microbacteriaceae bacterium]
MGKPAKSVISRAEAEAEIARVRKLGIIMGLMSLLSFPALLLTLFFLTGMTGGPFEGFAKFMVWPSIFLTILVSPLLLAFAFVQSMRVRNLRDLYRL